MSAFPVVSALRRATQSAHRALEEGADLEWRLAEACSRAGTLQAFHRFHDGVERRAHPVLGRLDAGFDLRSRAADLAKDLTRLGAAPLPRGAANPLATAGEALGWVYVAEGSMLGGRIIRRRLTADGVDLRGLDFLDPFGAATGERWQAFMRLLEDACAAGAARAADVVQGGIDAFAFAHDTLDRRAEALT